MCQRRQYITDTSTIVPRSLGKLTHQWSIRKSFSTAGYCMGWLFASSHAITEESFFHPGPQYGMQQLSSSGLGQCHMIAASGRLLGRVMWMGDFYGGGWVVPSYTHLQCGWCAVRTICPQIIQQLHLLGLAYAMIARPGSTQ